MAHTPEHKRLVIVASVAVALSASITTLVVGGPNKAPDIGVTIEPKTYNVDTKAYNDAVKVVRRDNPDAIDLLSTPAEPGAEVTTGVSLPKGRRIEETVEYTGSGFETVGIVQTDRIDATWVEVTSRNTSKDTARMSGWVFMVPL